MSTPSPPSDFDPKQIVNFVDSHTKEIGDLSKRITALEDKYGSNEKLADTLCGASETALKLQTMLRNTFVKALENDEPTKNAVKTIIGNTEREQAKILFNQYGGKIWAVIIFLFGLLAEALINKFIQ